MYEELNKLILDNCSEDSWYDDGFEYAQQLLSRFTEKDWERIFQEIDTKSNKWKIKLGYCIDEELGINGLRLLLDMLDGNEEVMEMTIDSLRSFDSKEYKSIVLSDSSVINKAQSLLVNASVPVKIVVEDFLRRFL